MILIPFDESIEPGCCQRIIHLKTYMIRALVCHFSHIVDNLVQRHGPPELHEGFQDQVSIIIFRHIPWNIQKQQKIFIWSSMLTWMETSFERKQRWILDHCMNTLMKWKWVIHKMNNWLVLGSKETARNVTFGVLNVLTIEMEKGCVDYCWTLIDNDKLFPITIKLHTKLIQTNYSYGNYM